MTDSSWYEDEQALLRSLRSDSGPRCRPPLIAGYEIVRELGRGGQGVVYEAIQRSTRRSVAIKLLLDGALASETTRLRFEREIDLVASLQHPHIVRLYDSGVTEAGHPYYVMEYIAGVPLDDLIRAAADAVRPAGASASAESLDLHQPSAASRSGAPAIRAALVVFHKICEAVNYAHQRGVIHRDLKPGNIRIDPAGEPHVLDFGLAKNAIQACVRASQPQMSLSGQFIGSLAWASPEQTEGVPSRVDVRTDVYSLGVLLYQLLTGRFPYAVMGSFPEVIETIRTAAPLRPRDVRPEVDDELETIVLKALAKEPQRRYQTAGELARDIERYLNHEPIEAKRDSAWYNVRKTLRRYRLVAGFGAAFLVVAVVAAITLSVLYGRALRAERMADQRRTVAETEGDKARRTQQFLQSMLGSLDPSVSFGRDAGLLRQILDDAALRVEDELKGRPEVEAPVRATIGRTYSALGDYKAAETNLLRALDLYRRTPDSGRLETFQVLSDLATVYQEQGRLDEAEPLAREALEGFRKRLGAEDRDTLTAMSNLALVLDSLGQGEAAEQLHRETLAARRRVFGENDPDTLSSKVNLAQILLDQGRVDEAAPLIRETLAARQELLGPDHPATLLCINNAARLAQEQGHLDEAETLYRQAVDGFRRTLGPEHPHTVMAVNNLAALYCQTRRLAKAEALLREALALQPAGGSNRLATATVLNNLARVLQESGKPAEAEPLLRTLLETLSNAYGEDHPRALTALNNLAGVLVDLGRGDDAIELFQRCLEIRRQTLGESHPETLAAGINLAGTLRDSGRLKEALAQFEATTRSAAELPAEHMLWAHLKGGHGETLLRLGRYAEAEPLLLASHAAFDGALGPEHPNTRRAAVRLFELYTAWGRPEQAAPYAAP